MKESTFFRELASDPFPYKVKKEMVIEYRDELVECYKRMAKTLSCSMCYLEILYDAKPLEYSDKYWDTKSELNRVRRHLQWLKSLSKRRLLKYALDYYWSIEL